MHQVSSRPPFATLALAAMLVLAPAAWAQPQKAAPEKAPRARGLQIGVSGDLGTGKTALIRALLRELGVEGPVKSPTFALLEPYAVSSLDCYHFDFYRFSDPAEFGSSGFRELFGPGRLCLIEWPERAGDRLPTGDVSITLRVDGDGRIASLVATSELGHACLTSAIAEYPADASS